MREKAIEYVSTSLMSMRHILFIPHPDNEKHLVAHVKKVGSIWKWVYSTYHPPLEMNPSLPSSLPLPLPSQALSDVTGEEFELFMEMLSKLQFLSTGHAV